MNNEQTNKPKNFKEVFGLAIQFGVSVEEVEGCLLKLSNAGLRGAGAGKKLRKKIKKLVGKNNG